MDTKDYIKQIRLEKGLPKKDLVNCLELQNQQSDDMKPEN